MKKKLSAKVAIVTGASEAIGAAIAEHAAEGGSIINVGSIVGPMPAPQASAYNASKAAVDTITISLSQELGPRKIRVNLLDPGRIDTEGLGASEMDKGLFREQQEKPRLAGSASRMTLAWRRHSWPVMMLDRSLGKSLSHRPESGCKSIGGYSVRHTTL